MSKRKQWAEFSTEIRSTSTGGDAEQHAPREIETEIIFTGRLRVLMFGVAAFLVIATARLVTWQLFGRTPKEVQPTINITDNARGRILDHNNLLLATDIFLWEIYVSPEDYRHTSPSPTSEDINRYAQTIGVGAEILRNALTQEGQATLVARNVSQEQCDKANLEADIPVWIWCDGRRLRAYPHGVLAGHVLGFVNADQMGQAGVEAAYNGFLRKDGDWLIDQLPGPPQPLLDAQRTYLPTPGGRDVVLNLNAALQYQSEKILGAALQTYQAQNGTVIVMAVRTGAILALANLPTYDPNSYAQADKRTWTNLAVADHYEPGSVMKVVTYAAALDAGSITPESIFIDTGERIVGGRKITNSEKRAVGTVTARQALALSLNVVSAEICLDLGQDTYYRYLRQFGFGKVTEADLGLESPGIVKRPGTASWSLYDQAANSFGQGISVTPLQMTNAVAAIANGGALMQPQLVQSLVYNGQVYRVPPRRLGQAIRPETALTMTRLMVFVMESYASGPDLVPGYRVAGKTGTAEIPQAGGYTSDLTITTFAGFLPAADPQIVILVKLVEPKTSRWAEQVALPVFGQIAREAVHVLKIAPDDRMP